MHRPGRSLLRARQAGSAGTPKPPRRQCRGGGGLLDGKEPKPMGVRETPRPPPTAWDRVAWTGRPALENRERQEPATGTASQAPAEAGEGPAWAGRGEGHLCPRRGAFQAAEMGRVHRRQRGGRQFPRYR